jgi:glycosyltransferase involved in cell wall biosynthesis
MNKPLISVISPVYGAEKIVDELVRQLVEHVQQVTTEYEIILVDDCGPDQSWDKIKNNCELNSKVKGIKLSRNFGQHFAITAGIEASKGDYIVVIDCDLQDDPKYIPEMYSKIKEGFDIVYTLKKKRKHSYFKNMTASFYNVVFNYLSENKNIHSHENVGAYSMISRKVADAYNSFNDYKRHYLLVLKWLGFKSCYLPIEHKERFSGVSGYTISKLLRHAMDGITSQSDRVLRMFVNIGLIISLLSFMSIITIIILYFIQGFMSGWTSLIIVLLFSTGIILTGIGVIGVYLGKTFEQTKNRPKYLIDEIVN